MISSPVNIELQFLVIDFKLVEDKLVAVAGSNTHAVTDPGSTHYWRLKEKTEGE